jgi:hypothetical protein
VNTYRTERTFTSWSNTSSKATTTTTTTMTCPLVSRRTFNFEEMRIDEALRIYLAEFRLPGEAPLISALLEQFAARWRVRRAHSTRPFVDESARF